MEHEVLELFPTPLYTTQLPSEQSSIIPWLMNQELHDNVDSSNYGERSKNSYLLDEPEAKDLSSFILDSVNIFAKDYLALDYQGYKFTQSWLSIKHPGQHHTRHSHPNSVISGVFFFGESEGETPALTFHSLEGSFRQNFIQLKTKSDKREHPFAWTEFYIKFEAGLLLLFPSHFHHSVPINETKKPRYSLAFNVVPIEGLGDELSLTELKF